MGDDIGEEEEVKDPYEGMSEDEIEAEEKLKELVQGKAQIDETPEVDVNDFLDSPKYKQGHN